MFLYKKSIIVVSLFIFIFLFSCSKKDNTEKKVDSKKGRSERPETGLKPDKPVILKYSFEMIPDGKLFKIEGNLTMKIKIVPDIKDQKKSIEIPSDFIFYGNLEKKGLGGEGNSLFIFTISKLNINSPGPGINIDYNSEISEKYLNPQIKKFDLIIGKEIPLIISPYGVIELDLDSFFSKYEDLKLKLTEEDTTKIKSIIGYFFLNYPEKPVKLNDSFKSEFPFNGEYKIDSLTKDGLNTLLIPGNSIISDKNIISSFLKGWIFIDNMGMLKRSYLQLTEKKYLNYKDVKSIIHKNILLDLKVSTE